MCLWTIFRITFWNILSVVGKKLIGRKFWWNSGSLPGFGNVITFASFQGFWKWDSRRQWLIKYVRCTSGLLGRCIRHSFGKPSVHKPFSISVSLLIYVCHKIVLRLQMRAELVICSPPAAHRFRHTGHEVRTGFLNTPQSRWLSRSGDIPKGPWTATNGSSIVAYLFVA
jgi:hypothetical protein